MKRCLIILKIHCTYFFWSNARQLRVVDSTSLFYSIYQLTANSCWLLTLKFGCLFLSLVVHVRQSRIAVELLLHMVRKSKEAGKLLPFSVSFFSPNPSHSPLQNTHGQPISGKYCDGNHQLFHRLSLLFGTFSPSLHFVILRTIEEKNKELQQERVMEKGPQEK